jgi:hypothetical protein
LLPLLKKIFSFPQTSKVCPSKKALEKETLALGAQHLCNTPGFSKKPGVVEAIE